MKLTRYHLIPAMSLAAIGFILMAITYDNGSHWDDFNGMGKTGMVMFCVGMAYIISVPFFKMVQQLFNRK